MKYLLTFILLVLVISAPAQSVWKVPSELYNDYGHEYSNTDSSFYYDGFYYLANAESLYIHLPTLKTLGQMKIWGYVTPLDSIIPTLYGKTGDTTTFSNKDTVYIALGPHHGNGRSMDANITHVLTAIDTANCDTGTSDSFEYYIPQSSVLADKPSIYYTLFFRGTANNAGKIYVKVEWITAY